MLSNFSIKHADQETKSEARQQLRVILSISLSPLLLGFLFIVAFSKNEISWLSAWTAFDTVFLDGELYFYAMSTCGYIFFLSSISEKRSIREAGQFSGLFVLFCGCFMALYIGQGEDQNTLSHGIVSIVLLLTAVIINYRMIVLSQQPPPMPEDVNRRRADDLADKVDTEYD